MSGLAANNTESRMWGEAHGSAQWRDAQTAAHSSRINERTAALESRHAPL